VKHGLIFFALFLSGQISYGNVQTGKTMSETNHHNWAFEENKGQVLGKDSAEVRFFYKQSPLTIFLRKSGLTYQFSQIHKSKENDDRLFDDHSLETEIKELPLNKIETYRMDMELVGANPHTEVIKEQASEDYIQYYNHNALDVRSYQRIIYRNVYEGIDWVVYLTPALSKGEGVLKYDFIVHAGADPSQIKMRIKWAEELRLDEQGNLIMKNRMGEIVEDAPFSFQEELFIQSKFKLNGSELSFEIGEYDKSKSLVIDPSLAWSSYYGGEGNNVIFKITSDSKDNQYYCGRTTSSTLIADGGHQMSLYEQNGFDAFLAKFTSDGQRIWTTYYGGNAHDYGYDCAVDDHDNVYLVGSAASNINIASNGFKNYKHIFGPNAFIAKFNKHGVRQWGTYFGYYHLVGYTCAIKDNALYIAGLCRFQNINSTIKRDTNFAYMGHQNQPGGGEIDGFIAKFDTMGNRIWATYYGGANDEQINDIAMDNQGNLYAVGTTNSIQNISQSGYQNSLNKGLNAVLTDGFIAKFNQNGQRMWSTYIGSQNSGDSLSTCTVDNQNNLIVCGLSNDTSFMTLGVPAYSNSGFIAKLNSSGSRIWASPYNNETADDCAVDKSDNIYIIGATRRYNPITNLYYNGIKTYRGFMDIQFAKFNLNGVLQWNSYFGGIGDEIGYGIEVDLNNNIYLGGATSRADTQFIFSDSLGYKGFQDVRQSNYVSSLLFKICQEPLQPEIALLSNSGTNICEGKEVIFNTQTKNAGLTPIYIWKKNGQNIGNNQPTFTTNQINDKDSIECWMVSSAACISQDTVKSNKLVFSVKKPDTTNAFDTVCDGTAYRFGSQNLTSAGIYQARLQDVNGCDSLVYLSLWFRPRSLYSYSFTTTCAQPSYFFKGQTRTVSGVYRDTLKAQNGCDSLVILNLTVKAPTSFIDSFQLCEGDSLKFGGNYIKSAGIYQRVIPNAVGCDSTITMTVSILRPVKKDSIVLSCPPYSYKGKTYEISTKILDTIYSYQGCDSIYLTIDAQIKDKPVRKADIRYEACDSMRIGGRLYRSSFQYIDTIRTKDALKCDSIYQPYFYTIYETPSARFYPRTKDTMLRGQTLKFRANTAEHYLWSTGHKESILEFKLTEDVQIYLIAWNHELCKDTSYLDLWAFDPIILDFPTGFNPMSSYPENRYFKPNYTGKLDAMQFDIFNRLGEKVYSSYNVHDLGWDGSYKNQLAPHGVYTYIFEYSSFRYRYIKTGEVLLVR
jgi:hypothetical protein